MQRDLRLHGLSSDHHHALRLATEIRRAAARDELNQPFVERVLARFEGELRPHFDVEEELLLPALKRVGAHGLVQHTLVQHWRMQALMDLACAGDLDALRRFGELLEEHIRFEERELFGECESRIDGSILAAVAERAPKGVGTSHGT